MTPANQMPSPLVKLIQVKLPPQQFALIASQTEPLKTIQKAIPKVSIALQPDSRSVIFSVSLLGLSLHFFISFRVPTLTRLRMPRSCSTSSSPVRTFPCRSSLLPTMRSAVPPAFFRYSLLSTMRSAVLSRDGATRKSSPSPTT